MNAYIYQSDIYCEDCAAKIQDNLPKGNYESYYDSETWPQGPYSDGGGEADCPQHCGACGLFLENPLTDDGYDYVVEALNQCRRGSRKVLRQWAHFYRSSEAVCDAAVEAYLMES